MWIKHPLGKIAIYYADADLSGTDNVAEDDVQTLQPAPTEAAEIPEKVSSPKRKTRK